MTKKRYLIVMALLCTIQTANLVWTITAHLSLFPTVFAALVLGHVIGLTYCGLNK